MVISNAVMAGTYRHYARLLLMLIIVLTGCSSDSGSGKGDNSTAGSVSFNLAWNGMQSQESVRLVTGNPCSDYNILWIHYRAIDQNGNVQSSGQWLCADRGGEISGLPWGTYSVIIQGEVSGEITWRGETAGIEVTDNQGVNAGTINMVHLYDHEAPDVISTLPADEESGVSVNSTITARFDEAIVEPSITVDNFTLTYPDQSGGENRVACRVRYDPDNHIAILTPTEDLLNDTTYTATIAVDQDIVVEDMASNPMQQAKQWTFTTFRPDEEAPYVQTRSPQHRDMNVELNALVQIRFSEAINSETISTDSIYLQHNGAVIQCDLRYDGDLNMVTLDPVNDLPPGSTCDVFVTTAITDISGNSLESTDTWSFVTQFMPWQIDDNVNVHAQSGSNTAITLETNDRIHIGVTTSDNQLVEIVQTSQNVWDTTVVSDRYSDTTAVSVHQDMVINEYDSRYVAFFDLDTSLLYICHEGIEGTGSFGAMGVVLVIGGDDNPIDPQGVSLAIAEERSDITHGASICYYNTIDSQLYYASDELDWGQAIVVDSNGEYPSLALEPTGGSHISYYDAANGHLKYATNTSEDGSWVTETVDDSENVGHHTAIALDGQGNPHISYRDNTNNALKYAAKQPSGDWLIETVDDSSSVALSTSIAMDSLGLAHISYHDSAEEDLMYATKTAMGSWHTAVVDDYGSTGTGSSITVDSQNYIHISYGYIRPAIAGSMVKYATTRPQQ